MFDYLTPDAIAAEVEMTASNGKSVLLLEGESDIKCLLKFFDESKVDVVAVKGKENAIEAVRILNIERKIANYLCLVDSDFDIIMGYNDEENILRTEYHDIEISILLSESFDRICKEYCTKFPSNQLSTLDELRQFLFQSLYPLSILKYLNVKNKWMLVFKGIDICEYFDKKQLCLDTKGIIHKVIANTKNHINEKISKAETSEEIAKYKGYLSSMVSVITVETELNNEIKKNYDHRQISNGHDTIGVFAAGLLRMFATLDHKVANSKHFEKIFRLSYDTIDFRSSKLYEDIKTWETRNAGILIS